MSASDVMDAEPYPPEDEEALHLSDPDPITKEPRYTWTAALMCSNCAAKWTIEVPRGNRIERECGDDHIFVNVEVSTWISCPNCGNVVGVRQDWVRQKEMAKNADSKKSD